MNLIQQKFGGWNHEQNYALHNQIIVHYILWWENMYVGGSAEGAAVAKYKTRDASHHAYAITVIAFTGKRW